MSYNPLIQGMGITNVGVGDPNVIFKRKFFIISKKDNVIAKAKPSELYWKTLYLSHSITSKFN